MWAFRVLVLLLYKKKNVQQPIMDTVLYVRECAEVRLHIFSHYFDKMPEKTFSDQFSSHRLQEIHTIMLLKSLLVQKLDHVKRNIWHLPDLRYSHCVTEKIQCPTSRHVPYPGTSPYQLVYFQIKLRFIGKQRITSVSIIVSGFLGVVF